MTHERRSSSWCVFALAACAACILVFGGCEDKSSNPGDNEDPVTLLVDSTAPARIERPAWIDDNTIVFSWDEGTPNTQLWTISLQGSQPIRFIADNAKQYLNPSHSADLGLVAFQILDDPANPFEGFNIDAAFRSDSSKRTRLVSQAESGSSTYPSWGVDGTNLGFMTTIDKTAYFVMQGVEIYQGIIRKVGDPTVVSLGQASRVAWHGPTNRVAYNRVPPMAETGNSIYYYDIGSPAERQLTDKDTNDGSDDQNPTWSPSGDHIIYSSFKDVDFRNELYAVSVETKNVSRITTTGDDETDPAWSPDGSRVAYVSNGDLYVLVLNTAILPD